MPDRGALRFVIDAQLPRSLAARMSILGCLAEHVDEIGLTGATDAEICSYAAAQQAVLVTKDHDFVQLARDGAYAGQVVWIRLGNTRNQVLWDALSGAFPEMVESLESGERIIEVG